MVKEGKQSRGEGGGKEGRKRVKHLGCGLWGWVPSTPSLCSGSAAQLYITACIGTQGVDVTLFNTVFLNNTALPFSSRLYPYLPDPENARVRRL